MKILISAGEPSADLHGAQLLKSLRTYAPMGKAVEAFGMGGPALQKEGLKAVVDSRELSVMGFIEVLAKIFTIRKALAALEKKAAEIRPDVAVLIDYPDFHFRLAARLKKLGIPVISYIPPKVWVWRKSRIKVMEELFKKVLCIFPFEREFYSKTGVPAAYVGNPLMDELPLNLTSTQAREELQIPPHATVLTLMPGSRSSELRIHIPLMLDAAVRAAARLRSFKRLGKDEPLRVLMPLPESVNQEKVSRQLEAYLRGGYPILDFRLSTGNSATCLAASDAALVKSGTSTLEAALMGCPHAVVYKTGKVTAFLYRAWVRYQGPVGLVNLVKGWKPGDPYVVSEILLEKATSKNLSREVEDLLTNADRRAEIKKDFDQIKSLLEAGDQASPSLKAAQEIWNTQAQH